MKILATDLDRTLLPNGRWPADEAAIPLFNELTRQHQVTVVYVTGRNLRLAEQAIAEYGIRHPDVLIGDVGTSIRIYRDQAWETHEAWDVHVRSMSPRWDPEQMRPALAGIAGLVPQEPEHCGPFKQSFYVEHDRSQDILEQVREMVADRFDEVIIYSHDSQSGQGLLDLLPASATKQTALEFLATELGVAHDEVVFCGDSGNDIFPLTAGFSGVLVRNADAQLVASVEQAMIAKPELRVYFARGGWNNLSGYYTSGVLEGAAHYGLFEPLS
jgi:sucrose-6F-phosphate phosphohydrolase